jgi:hypothetical protein
MASSRLVCALAIASAFINPPRAAEATDLPTFGGNGGSPFRAVCPGNSFLAGFDGHVGAFIDHLRLVCVRWDRFTSRLGRPGVYPPQIGLSNGGAPQQGVCNYNSGYVVVGMSVSTLASDNRLAQMLALRCDYFNPPIRAQFVTGFADASFGTLGPAPSLFQESAGMQDYMRLCPNGQVAKGVYGRSGLFIDRIGLVCASTDSAWPQFGSTRNRASIYPR